MQTKITCDDFRGEDIIDSRDLIAALAELEQMAEDGEEYDADLLAAIRELADAGIEDWQYGATFVADSYFVEYAKELAEDTGAIGKNLEWPLYCIDWEYAANVLQHDYTAYDFLGVTYWVR
jgi:hypothetical protein